MQQALASWIFGSLLLIFLMWAFVFGPDKLSSEKKKLLGLFAALLAGLFGFFFTGNLGIDAVTQYSEATKVTIKAGGGAAFFVLVFFLWSKKKGLGKG